MPRYSRPQAAYPGEWAFILGAKVVAAIPAHERQERKRGAEEEEIPNNEKGFQGLLEKVVEGEITGTSHLHVSVTIGLSATSGARLPVITTAPTGDADDSGDGDGTSVGSDDQSTIDGYPRPTNGTVGPPSAIPELDGGYEISTGRGPNKGAVAGGVIGALLFLSLLVALFIFRHRIRQKIISRKYNRMGGTPDPIAVTRYGELKPTMTERGPLRSLFGSKATHISRGRDMNFPPPAMIRYSSTTSRRESRNSRYVRKSLLRGDSLCSPPDRGTFYNPSSPPSSGSCPPPQFRPLPRANSDRFPIALPPGTSSPTSTSTSSTLTDEFFHVLSQPKVPLAAPQPVAAIPAFLNPETPIEPKDSHFSWSTTKTPQVPPTPVVDLRASIADSEPRLRRVNSWVNNQRGRMEKQGDVVR